MRAVFGDAAVGPHLPHSPAATADRTGWWLRIERSVALLVSVSTLAVGAFTWVSIHQVNSDQHLTREGQITDRYNTAVTNLGDDSQDVRLGGLYALQRIMQDSPRDETTILSIVCTYIRNHARLPHKSGGSDRPANDIAAALRIVGSTTDPTRLPHPLDFSETDLTGTDLRGFHLADAYLVDADLSGADLHGADLTNANLISADLHGATLSAVKLTDVQLMNANMANVNLNGAVLRGADLRGADLEGADVRRALLQGADLQDAQNLTRNQIASAEANGARGGCTSFAPVDDGPSPICIYWGRDEGR